LILFRSISLRRPLRRSGEPPGVAVPGNILKPAPSFK
jgi:hypothetical protein